jgi:hypothetical protein
MVWNMMLDKNAIISGLFLPMLLWTGSVIAISWFGYPGVVCMTPMAWLLALPVGVRVRRESVSTGTRPVLEAAMGGGILGLWQGLLVPAVMVASSYLPGKHDLDPPNPFLIAAGMVMISVPVTACLAALTARLVRQE